MWTDWLIISNPKPVKLTYKIMAANTNKVDWGYNAGKQQEQIAKGERRRWSGAQNSRWDANWSRMERFLVEADLKWAAFCPYDQRVLTEVSLQQTYQYYLSISASSPNNYILLISNMSLCRGCQMQRFLWRLRQGVHYLMLNSLGLHNSTNPGKCIS